jgi:hypothetical protein
MARWAIVAGAVLLAGGSGCCVDGRSKLIRTAPNDERRLAFVTIIPLQRNDGTAVAEPEIQAILSDLNACFGGLTDEGEVDGYWVDPETQTPYRERGRKIIVAFEPERLEEAREAVRSIGAQLGQLAMYFALHEHVEILDVQAR